MAIKRFTTVLFMSCLVGATLVSAAAPALSGKGAAPRKIPKVVQVQDPAGDANFLNGQSGGNLPLPGDTSTPADLSVADILRVWFTNDAKTISVHIQTEAPPPAFESAYNFTVGVDPYSDNDPLGNDRCLYFDLFVEGPTRTDGPLGRLVSCQGLGSGFKGPVTTTQVADGTGITTMTVPRSADPAFAAGEILKSPRAWAYQWSGGSNVYAALAVVDDTKPGKNYVITRR